MLTSDDRKEVDLHLQRGSIARGVFRDILELVIFSEPGRMSEELMS